MLELKEDVSSLLLGVSWGRDWDHDMKMACLRLKPTERGGQVLMTSFGFPDPTVPGSFHLPEPIILCPLARLNCIFCHLQPKESWLIEKINRKGTI